MEHKILGLHHITAIAGNARRNYEFYTKVLGLRFVKKTVNFDDPGTYHFYFGDEVGTPGTILTFFPWERISKGRQGAGMATEIKYAVPSGSLDLWKARLTKNGIHITGRGEKLGEEYLSFEDPDGLPLTLVIPHVEDRRKPWETDEVDSTMATRGFYGVTLTLRSMTATATILEDVLGYTLLRQEGQLYRYITHAVKGASVVDVLEAPGEAGGINAGGTIHHVAFRVKDEEVLMGYREKVLQKGLHITPKIDRNYFYSLYFREPGGVLFELATDHPGFTVDESVEQLGRHLKLPAQYETRRAEIEKVLPRLKE